MPINFVAKGSKPKAVSADVPVKEPALKLVPTVWRYMGDDCNAATPKRLVSAIEYLTDHVGQAEYLKLYEAIYTSYVGDRVIDDWTAFIKKQVSDWEPDDEDSVSHDVDGNKLLIDWANEIGGWPDSDESIAKRAQEVKEKAAAEAAKKDADKVLAEQAQLEKAISRTTKATHSYPCPAPFPGVMERIVTVARKYERREQHEMAIAGALAGMSAGLHGRHALDDKLRGNLYIVCISQSATGKDHVMDIPLLMNKILAVPTYTDVASGEGIEDALQETPSRRGTLLIDEVHELILNFSGKTADRLQRKIAALFLKLYSRSRTLVTERLLSTKQSKSKKEYEIMYHPYVVLFGTSTPEKMQGLSAELVKDGTLGRVLLVRGNDRPQRKHPKGDMYAELREAIYADGVRVSSFLPPENAGLIPAPGEAIDVPMKDLNDGVRVYPFSSDAEKLYLAFEDAANEIRESDDTATEVLRGRGPEQAKRIALVLAAWDNAKEVSAAHLQWAIEFVNYSQACLLNFVESMTDSQAVTDAQKILEVIHQAVAGKAPFSDQKANQRAKDKHEIEHSPLYKKFQNMGTVRFGRAIEHLESLDEIAIAQDERKAGRRGGNTGSHYTFKVK
jgi:hypothetical protein